MKNFEEIYEALPSSEIIEISEDYYLESICLEGKNPAIVFVHGGGGSLYNPYHQLDFFKGKYGLVTYHLSGYGRSSYRKDQSLKDHVKDLRDLIQYYGLQDVVIHGHSYGTEIALEYAKNYSPRGLILTGGGAYDLIPKWEKPFLKVFLALKLYKLPANWFMKRLAGLALHPETPEEIINDFLKSNPMPQRRSAWETISKSFWDYSPVDLHQIEVPTLILHGPEDGIVPIKGAEKTAKEMPNAEFRMIPKTGHVPMAERPKEYNEILENFMDRLS